MPTPRRPSNCSQPLRGWNLLQLRIEMHAAPARDLQLPLPILEPRLLHRDRVISLRDLNIGRSVADKTTVDFNISTVGNRADRQFARQYSRGRGRSRDHGCDGLRGRGRPTLLLGCSSGCAYGCAMLGPILGDGLASILD